MTHIANLMKNSKCIVLKPTICYILRMDTTKQIEENFYNILQDLYNINPQRDYFKIKKSLRSKIEFLEKELTSILEKKTRTNETITYGGIGLRFHSDLSLILSGVNSGKSMMAMSMSTSKTHYQVFISVENKIKSLIKLYETIMKTKVNLAKIIINKINNQQE
jgi:hypothetical protein